jgi:hypothetical protein
MMTRHEMWTAAVAVLAGCGCLAPGLAKASPASRLSASTLSARFVPDVLGAASTIELGFQIHRLGGEVPPPLTGVDFGLPAGVSLSTSELGLASCDRQTLARRGSAGCQPDAVMGYGEAVILAPDAVEALVEPVDLTLLMGPAENRHTTLLFYVSGDSPVIAQAVFSGQLVEESGLYPGRLGTTIPLMAGLPGEPDTTVVSMRSSIGSRGVTYYKRVHGVKVAYTPKGVSVPLHCPAGGFPFAVTFTFANGSREFVPTTAPCPLRRRHIRHRRGRSR